MLNGYSSINLTKLDVLTGFEELKIGYAYEVRVRVSVRVIFYILRVRVRV